MPDAELSPREREIIVEQLREEALASARQAGCTCEPELWLTEHTFGPHRLPAWITGHSDECVLSARFNAR